MNEPFKSTKDDIGKEFYPVDNSYSQHLSNGEYPKINNGCALAGSSCQESVKVKILTEPLFISIINVLGNPVTQEFVMVEYSGDKFLVLNIFTKKPQL